MQKIALTGNIASGKSLVQKYMEKSGLAVIDADDICHELLEKDENTISEIKKAFTGHDITDNNGELSRKKISNLVFSNPKLKKTLEEIIHPKVREEIEGYIENQKGKRLVVVAIPLLFESGFDAYFDKIIFISAGEDIRLARLMKSNALSREAALRILSSQRSEEEKIPHCDFVIYNNNSQEELYSQVDAVLSEITC